MTPAATLILASSSPHRRALLERLQVPFRCLATGVPEDELPSEVPATRAARLAMLKARSLATDFPSAVVIGCDQVASLESGGAVHLLHKSGDRPGCRRQLQLMSGRLVNFETAVAVIHGATVLTHADTTQVRFRKLDDAAIESYMDREPSFDCAGGFKCEGLGVSLFESIETRDPTALIGLPLIGLCALLRKVGVQV